MDEKIKTWTLLFPAKENPNMEKALFDRPIVLQHDFKAMYQLISRKFSGMKFLHPSVRLTNQKPRTFVSPLVPLVVSVLLARFHFKVIRKSLKPVVLLLVFCMAFQKFIKPARGPFHLLLTPTLTTFLLTS